MGMAWFCVGIMPSLSFRFCLALPAGLALVLGIEGGDPARAQVLLHVPLPNGDLMQAQGLQLATNALRLAQFGQTEEALRRLQLAVAMVPTSSELLYALGNVYLELGNSAQAVQVLQRARALAPPGWGCPLLPGSGLLAAGQLLCRRRGPGTGCCLAAG
jgi:tetratricopeptide (TPR) repeat protein